MITKFKALALSGAAAFGFSSCGDVEPQQAEAQTENAPRPTVSAIGESKSKSSVYTPPTPRAFDPQKATPEELAARERLEERLAQAKIDQVEADAKRAEERAQRIEQMTERFTTVLREADANGDGLLAQDEVSGPFARAFTTADANGDGFLDGAEQQAAMSTILERMSQGGGGGRRERGGGDRGRGGGGGRGRN